MISDNPESGETVIFSITFSTDRDRFFRRSCPSCGRDFKLETDEADLVTALQPAFRRMGLEVGPEPSQEDSAEQTQYFYCPYCEHRAESSDTLTSTFEDYLKRYAMREYVLPKVNAMLSGFTDSFPRNSRRSGGLISLEINFEHDKAVLPPRPIAGPEPPDMTIVELLCCNKRAKMLDNWYGLRRCPYCGTEVALC